MPISVDSKKVLNAELVRLQSVRQGLNKQIDALKVQIDDLKNQLAVVVATIDKIKTDADAV